ncbi:MAG: hypothetical protein QOE90_3574 [Thermoplasmata archaeon]|jgi:hypothetical protein|nr:hypothetical protein [Thermoplasmata archaeon]
MLVSGIVITIAFLLTALTLSQVSSIERQAAADKPTSLATEWRFLHDRLQTNLNSAVTVDTTNDTFVNTTWPAVAASFRGIEAEKGYDLVLRIAGNNTGGLNAFNLTENGTGVTSGGAFNHYSKASFDGSVSYTWNSDHVDDGLIWNPTCLDTTNGAGWCLQGVLVSMHMADATTSIDEVVLFAVNKG